jgi:hypothetical protein|tara:strand:- start:17 stop:763 length:747 start_codon:yes stop_codon:yes gene_type:complete
MAISTVYLDDRGAVRKSVSGQASYEAARSAARGTNTTTGTSAFASNIQSVALGVDIANERGVTKSSSFYRAYYSFDIGAIIGTDTISAISLNVFGTSNSGGDCIVVKANSNASFGTIATSDYPNVFNSTTSMTAYSSAIATWSTSTLSPNSITLNGTAVDNMNAAAAKYLTIGLINNEHDYSNVTATAVYSKFNGVRFDPTGVYRAYLSVTHAASGFSLDVNGVLGTNIGDINKVDQASIAGLNGVSA